MSVFGNLGDVGNFIGFDTHCLDGPIFRLHTKVTVIIIMTFVTIVLTGQYVGDPIDCVVEDIPSSVMDTYCRIHSTFTLPRKILNAEEKGSSIVCFERLKLACKISICNGIIIQF